MKPLDGITQRPAFVAFGMRRGGGQSFAVTRDASSLTLTSDGGAGTVLPAATQTDAGLLSAADKSRLDGTTEPASSARFASRAEAAAATIASSVVWISTLGYHAAGDGGAAVYLRSTAQPAHGLSVQSADGAWWDFVPERPGIVRIEQCGAVADGVADDTAAFEAFRSWVIHALGDGMRGPDWPVTLELKPGGHHTYTVNRWPYAIPRLRVQGNGARLECTADNGWEVNARPLNLGFWFEDRGYAPVDGTEAWLFGHRMADSAAGQTVVNLQTAADAAEYAAGDIVLVAGCMNMGQGQPPDYRYFETREVAGSDPVAGTVTLTERLGHAYRADWPVIYVDSSSGEEMGPARILKIDRPAQILTRYFEINDVTFVANRNRPGLSNLALSQVLHVAARNIDATGLVSTGAGAGRLMEFENCRFGTFEGDKLGERILFRDCSFTGNLGSFVGVKKLEMTGCTLRGGDWRVAAHDQTLRDVVFDNVNPGLSSTVFLRNYYASWKIGSQLIENPTVLGPHREFYDFEWDPPFETINFPALGAGDVLLLPKRTDFLTFNAIMPGDRLVSDDGAALCEIIDIVAYDADNHALEVQWLSALPSFPVNLTHRPNTRFEVSGGNADCAVAFERDRVRLRFSEQSLFWSAKVLRSLRIFGRVEKVTVNVTKASGATGPDEIWFTNHVDWTDLMKINLRQVGYREATAAGITNARTGDVHDPADWKFVQKLLTGPFHTGTWQFRHAEDPADEPQLAVEIFLRPMV